MCLPPSYFQLPLRLTAVYNFSPFVGLNVDYMLLKNVYRLFGPFAPARPHGWRRHTASLGLAGQRLPKPDGTFRSADLVVKPVPESELQTPPPADKRGFGLYFSDHMAEIDWNKESGWAAPQIHKLQPFNIHPASKALHYAIQLFEGMKAFRGVDNRIRLFRPELNMARMRRTAVRSSLADFDGEELISVISQLVHLDEKWVPHEDFTSLYIRPTLIGTDGTLGVTSSRSAKLFVLLSPVGEYFSGGSKGVRLLADPKYTRAFRGGVGAYKMGSNYAPTIQIGEQAAAKNCQQVLWLSGDEQWVTEAGAMNICVFWKNKAGEDELITASLDSETILPGVTRQSVLDLAREWKEFKVSERDFTMNELEEAIKEGRVYEMFGCGTAAVVSPVSGLHMVKDRKQYVLDIPTLESERGVMKRLYREITDIQYGRKEKAGWTRIIA